MSITTQCLLVNLQIGMWNGQRLDKEASRKVTREANAETDAASVNKHTIPKTALADIQTAASAIRTHFYNATLPWKDNGDRVLSRQMYFPFLEAHRGLLAQFERQVSEFIDTRYPAAVEQASFRMGELFKAQDYPSAEALRRRFYVTLDVDAVTEAADFRVDMDATHVDAIRAQMTAALEQRMGRAMQDVWSRLMDAVSHFAAKMEPGEVFRDSTVRNMEEIVDLLPALNIVNDADLEQMRTTIRSTIMGYDPNALRKNPAMRAQAATEAQQIMEEMSGFMTAFGGGK